MLTEFVFCRDIAVLGRMRFLNNLNLQGNAVASLPDYREHVRGN